MKKIKLTQGKYALVDDADFEWLNQWKWCANKDKNTFYAKRSGRKDGKWTLLPMHRVITNAPKGKLVDHRDTNGLNNRRENLRICTRVENGQNARMSSYNTSGFKGVGWDKYRKKWHAEIVVNRKRKVLGRFTNKKDAARAYDTAAEKYFGEFARLNFSKKKSNTSK